MESFGEKRNWQIAEGIRDILLKGDFDNFLNSLLELDPLMATYSSIYIAESVRSDKSRKEILESLEGDWEVGARSLAKWLKGDKDGFYEDLLDMDKESSIYAAFYAMANLGPEDRNEILSHFTSLTGGTGTGEYY